MPDIEQNKRNVIAYYERAFNDHEPEDAVERYVGSEYIQHNPTAPDGTDAFIAFGQHDLRCGGARRRGRPRNDARSFEDLI